VEFARDTIGTQFEEYTGHVEREQIGDRNVVTNRETRVEERHDFAAGDFARFASGEAVVCRQGNGWVHGRVRLLG
jgi:hypothetical protein